MKNKAKFCTSIIIFCIIISSFGCATGRKHDPMTGPDLALYSTALALHSADWLQTKTGVQQPSITESNVMLGASPSQKNIDTYFVATAIGMSAVTWYLPKDFRKAVLLSWTVIGAITVMHNNSIGVQLTF